MEQNHEQIMLMLGRLEGKVDGVLEQAKKTNGRVTELEKITRNHADFILTVKTKVGMVAGVISIIGAISYDFIKSKLGI